MALQVTIMARLGRSARGRAGRILVSCGLFGLLTLVFMAGGSALARVGAAAPDEQPQLRNATTKVFKLPDGSFQAEIHSVPIHYQVAGGAWKEIDSTLAPSQAAGVAYQNAANGFSLRFASSASSPALVSLSAGTSALEFGLEGASSLSQPLALGDLITYGEAYPGVDLSFQSLPEGVKESLTVKSRPFAPLSFRFPLSLLGLRPNQKPDGSVSLESGSGKQVFRIPRPVMVDSSPAQALSGNLSYSLASDQGTLVLTLTPDPAWLQDPARVYPVTIDPL